jgi:hypothetical protein
MDARPDETLTDDELAAQAAEPLPDREVMSVICPPEDAGIVAGDWTGGDAETAWQEPPSDSETIPPGEDETAEHYPTAES